MTAASKSTDSSNQSCSSTAEPDSSSSSGSPPRGMALTTPKALALDWPLKKFINSPERTPLTTAVYSILHSPTKGKVACQVPINVYQAMYNNGMILGLTCATVLPQKSIPAPHAPPALRPTKLQLETVHLPWIDRFPFPSWRDNMIRMEKEFNDEEFLCDCFNMDCFTIRLGGVGWEPRDWSVDKNFLKKWAW